MQRLFQTAFLLVASIFLTLNLAVAQDRSITLLPDTDLPGFDYSIGKGISLDQCEAACTDDKLCRAFTYNAKSKWCFFKGQVGTAQSFAGATSGQVEFSPTLDEIITERVNGLPFPARDLY